MHKINLPVYAPIWNSMAAQDWELETTADLSVVMSAPYRVAAVPVLCTESFEFSYNDQAMSLPWDQFDLVILSDIEFRRIEEIHAWAKKIGIRNYVLAVGGRHVNESLDPDRMLWRPWWSFNLMRMNSYQSTQANCKPYKFDALLGARRPHRDYVMLGMQASGLIDQSIVTYRDVFNGGFVDSVSEAVADRFPHHVLQFPYVSPNLNHDWEVGQQITNSISPFVPWDIYRQTDYTVICETLGTFTEFFMSEKTAKVFLAKRVFVLFGNYQFLMHLHEQGFQTFGSVIDESYDNIRDNLDRYAAAWQQVERLAQQPAAQVYEKLWPVLEHNHNRLFELQTQTRQLMHSILTKHIPAEYWD